MAHEKITSYQKFWPYYLKEHRKDGTQTTHIIGTAIAITLLVFAIVTVNLWFLLAAVFAGYFFAWIGHFFIEKNRPATFTYPFWSLISDFRLFFMFISGRLAEEYRRHGIK